MNTRTLRVRDVMRITSRRRRLGYALSRAGAEIVVGDAEGQGCDDWGGGADEFENGVVPGEPDVAGAVEGEGVEDDGCAWDAVTGVRGDASAGRGEAADGAELVCDP